MNIKRKEKHSLLFEFEEKQRRKVVVREDLKGKF